MSTDVVNDQEFSINESFQSSRQPLPLLHYQEVHIDIASRRVNFTCLHASENFIACGAHNGSIFLYATTHANQKNTRRFPSKYHLIKTISPSSKDRIAISCLRICPNQKYLVVGTRRGVVYALYLTDVDKIGEKVAFTHDYHAGFPITCCLWDTKGHRFFSGCNGGVVVQTVVRAGVSAIFGSTDTEFLLKEGSGIVQLDLATDSLKKKEKLIVSSQVRVLILNLSSSESAAVAVGTKVRQGNYGACFSKDAINVFSSRPGRRLWIADASTGKVNSTLKFTLSKQPTSFLKQPTVGIQEKIDQRQAFMHQLAQFPFQKDTKGNSLVSWSIGTSALMFLDADAVEVTEWHTDLGIIYDLHVLPEKQVLLVLHGRQDDKRISTIQVLPPRLYLEIYAKNNVDAGIKLVMEKCITDSNVLLHLKKQWELENDKEMGSEEQYSLFMELLADSAPSSRPVESGFQSGYQLGSMSSINDYAETEHTDEQEIEVTLPIGNENPYQETQYYDVLAPNNADSEFDDEIHLAAASPQLEFVPDFLDESGSFLYGDSRAVDIGELSNTSVIPMNLKSTWLEDVFSHAQQLAEADHLRHESSGALTSQMNNIVTKAIPTQLNLSNMNHTLGQITNLPQHLQTTVNLTSKIMPIATGKAAIGGITNLVLESNDIVAEKLGSMIFGSVPNDIDDRAIILDPVDVELLPELLRSLSNDNEANKSSSKRANPVFASVVRLAMQAAASEDADIDMKSSEVLLEAIAMDMRNAKAKIKQIEGGPSEEVDESILADESNKNARTSKEIFQSAKEPSHNKKIPPATILPALNDLPTKAIHPTAITEARQQAFYPRAFLSANSLGSAVQFQCLLQGQLLSQEMQNETASIVTREMSDLHSELLSAMRTASTIESNITKLRVWPSSGITRIAACLCNIYLHHGDLDTVTSLIQSWMKCFDPKASETNLKELSKNGEPIGPPRASRFKRGEALVEGDGMPLTRKDWILVRVMVTLYFSIQVVGINGIDYRLCSSTDSIANGMYIYEMGVALSPRQNADIDESTTWSENEALEFVKTYENYLNVEFAVEICSVRKYVLPLEHLIQAAIITSNLANQCDEIIQYLAENDVENALNLLKESTSQCVFLHLLLILLRKAPLEAITECVKRYPHVLPWNVERNLFGEGLSSTSPDELSLRSTSQLQTYLQYLVALIQDDNALSLIDGMVGLTIRFLELTMYLQNENSLSVEFIQTVEVVVNRIIGTILVEEQKVESIRTLHVLLLELKMLSIATQTFTKLFLIEDDKKSLTNSFLYQILLEPNTTLIQMTLEHLVECLQPLHKDTLLEQIQLVVNELVAQLLNKEITDSSNVVSTWLGPILLALASSIGIDKTLELILSSSWVEQLHILPSQVFKHLLQIESIKNEQYTLVCSMLESLDAHIWGSRRDAEVSLANVSSSSNRMPQGKASFAPAFTSMFHIELGNLHSSMTEQEYADWYKAIKSSMETSALEFQKEVVPQSTNWNTFEFQHASWGVNVQLHDSSCTVCDLPVIMIATDNTSLDVVVHQCGHAFHRQCMQDDTCLLCQSQNYESLI